MKSNLLTIASKWTFHFKPCLLTGSCQEMKKFASVNTRWKKKESYWLAQPIIAHGSASAGCWKTRAREQNSRPCSRTTVFTLTDYRAIQQTRPRIAQCKPGEAELSEYVCLFKTTCYKSSNSKTFFSFNRIQFIEKIVSSEKKRNKRLNGMWWWDEHLLPSNDIEIVQVTALCIEKNIRALCYRRFKKL